MLEEIKAFRKYIKKNISDLEIEKSEINKEIEKITRSFQAHSIEKLTNLSNQVNEIDHTIQYFWSLFGGINEDTLKKHMED